MGGTSYKTLYELSERRWDNLRQHLQDCVHIGQDANPKAINFDVNTLLQVIVKMDTMKD